MLTVSYKSAKLKVPAGYASDLIAIAKREWNIDAELWDECGKLDSDEWVENDVECIAKEITECRYAKIPVDIRRSILEFTITLETNYMRLYRLVRCLVYFGEIYSMIEAKAYCGEIMRASHARLNIRNLQSRYEITIGIVTLRFHDGVVTVSDFIVSLPKFECSAIYEKITFSLNDSKYFAIYIPITNSLTAFARWVLDVIRDPGRLRPIHAEFDYINKQQLIESYPECRDQLMTTMTAELLTGLKYRLITPAIWRERFANLSPWCTPQQLYDAFHSRCNEFGVLITQDWAFLFHKRFQSCGAVKKIIERANIHEGIWIGTVGVMIGAKTRKHYLYESYLGKSDVHITRGVCPACATNIIVNEDCWETCLKCGCEVHQECEVNGICAICISN